jgi:hypothetical protein
VQQVAEQRTSSRLAIREGNRGLPSIRCERGLAGFLAGILLALDHLLDERFCFFVIGKGECGGTLFQLKSVEKGPVLIVRETIINLLVPKDASPSRLHVDHHLVSSMTHEGKRATASPTDTSTSLIQNV